MAKRFARKVKRAGKSATQFRFTSTFEYIDLSCNGNWRPEKLRVIWLRSHRRVQSTEVEFVVTEDKGPNGAEGRAVFDPPITVSLVVTLYRDSKKQEFEEKEYKYYIEHEDKSGKKILASFNCDMAEYAGIPTSRHALEMNFKPVSRKISKSLLGITLESEFIKEGKDTDEDMQSTFSSVDPAQSTLYADDEDIDDDDLDEAATLGMRASSNMEESTVEGGGEGEEPRPTETIGDFRLLSTSSIITLGTGKTLKRRDINPSEPPSKPPRTHNETKPIVNETNVPNEEEEEEEKEESKKELNNVETASETVVTDTETPVTEPVTEPAAIEAPVIKTLAVETTHETNTIETTATETAPVVATTEPATVETVVPETETPSIIAAAIVKETLATKETAPEETAPEKTAPEETAPEKTAPEETATEESATESVHTEETAIETVATEVSTETAAKETVAKETINATTVEEAVAHSSDAATDAATPLTNAHTNSSQATPIGSSNADISSDEMFNPKKLYKMSSKDSNNSIPVVKDVPNDKIGPEIKRTPQNTIGQSLEGTAPENGEVPPQEEPDRRASNPFDPPNPFDNPPPQEEPPVTEEPPPRTNTGSIGRNAALIETWLPDAQFVDNNDTPVSKDRIDSADVIGLYFSAQWCPPCRRFLPKLLEFYNALKNNGKSFELIYVSNDNSRTEMIQYMAEQQMPWLAIPHGHSLIDKLKLSFKVRSIPLLVIVGASGEMLDENAKKAVENNHGAASSVVKQYTKWLERTTGGEEEVKQKQSTGILGSIKKALTKDIEKEETVPPSPPMDTSEHPREAAESKTPKSQVNEKNNKDELVRQLQEKEDLIRHLEEVNQSLKHTNEELNMELRTAKSSLEVSEKKVRELEESTAQKKEEYAKFQEYLKVQGWLFKKGAKGPTANVFRRRYFRLDQGSKLYYYKSQSEGTPQGFIDLVKIIKVDKVPDDQQDKNSASFNIDCEGRKYELQAHDRAEMEKWISAIRYLKDYYKKKGHD